MNEVIMIIVVFIGPIIAVLITLWHTDRKEKRLQKMNLFLTLLATRKSTPMPIEFVNSLNLINIVFSDDVKVIDTWKKLFEAYTTSNIDQKVIDRCLLNLLDEIAKALGYKNIQQTNYDSFFEPSEITNQRDIQSKINTELLRVLENTENFGSISRSDQNNKKPPFV